MIDLPSAGRFHMLRRLVASLRLGPAAGLRCKESAEWPGESYQQDADKNGQDAVHRRWPHAAQAGISEAPVL
jgi:hypothetical protein